jgi:hypothetical protein
MTPAKALPWASTLALTLFKPSCKSPIESARPLNFVSIAASLALSAPKEKRPATCEIPGIFNLEMAFEPSSNHPNT